MNIFDMANDDLANVLEVLSHNHKCDDWTLYGFSDDKEKRYRAVSFLQEAASRLYRMNDKNDKPEKDDKPEEDDKQFFCKTTEFVIPTYPEEQKQEKQKPDEEPTLTEREVLKKAVVMLAEAVKDRSSSSAFDTCNKVLEMMRKLEK